MYRYGVKKMSRQNEKIVISLTYSPKNTTMRRKLGNLPVEYRRVNVESDEELALFEELLKNYKFNLREEEEEEEEQTTAPPSPKKIKCEPPPHLPPPPLHTDPEIVSLLDEDDNMFTQQFIF